MTANILGNFIIADWFKSYGYVKCWTANVWILPSGEVQWGGSATNGATPSSVYRETGLTR